MGRARARARWTSSALREAAADPARGQRRRPSLQDSTPILERMEGVLPRAAHPSARSRARVPRLGADRGVRRRVGQQADVPLPLDLRGRPGVRGRAHRARSMLPDVAEAASSCARSRRINERMVPRLSFVGSSARRATRSRARSAASSRSSRRISSGVRICSARVRRSPTSALYAQLYQCSTRSHAGRAAAQPEAPRTPAWIERMLAPKAEGTFEPWERARADARAAAARRDRRDCSCRGRRRTRARSPAGAADVRRSTLEGQPFTQETQKYHARRSRALRARYADVRDRRRSTRCSSAPGVAGGSFRLEPVTRAVVRTNRARGARPRARVDSEP